MLPIVIKYTVIRRTLTYWEIILSLIIPIHITYSPIYSQWSNNTVWGSCCSAHQDVSRFGERTVSVMNSIVVLLNAVYIWAIERFFFNFLTVNCYKWRHTSWNVYYRPTSICRFIIATHLWKVYYRHTYWIVYYRHTSIGRFIIATRLLVSPNIYWEVYYRHTSIGEFIIDIRQLVAILSPHIYWDVHYRLTSICKFIVDIRLSVHLLSPYIYNW